MALFARSDVMSVGIPPEAGGCGVSHHRPVSQGAPIRIWELNCPACERFLRETDLAHDINKPDKHSPRNANMPAHVVGNWSDSPVRIPLTPDELEVAEQLEAQGTREMAQNAQRVAGESIEAAKLKHLREQENYTREAERQQHETEIRLLQAEMAELRAILKAQQPAPAQPAAPAEEPVQSIPVEIFRHNAKLGICIVCGSTTKLPGAKGPAPKTCPDCRERPRE
jgi:hypothetical protein